VILKPFFRFYGGKWRAANRYPTPVHDTIIEPFAGSAGYALRFADRDVILVERDPVLAEMWRWLIDVSPSEVRSIPLVDSVDDLPSSVTDGARALVGFSMNGATSSPRRSLSAGARRLREAGRKLYGWTEALRDRVASQVGMIKHWTLMEGDYSVAFDIEATWFIDPPYQGAGRHYRHHQIDYSALGTWCRKRTGQVIVCEQDGASWLPFRSIGNVKSGPISKSSAEAVWTKETA
jgi:hypothetical protein